MDLHPADAPFNRRAVLALLGWAAAWPSVLRAQNSAKPLRIAFLAAGAAPRQGRFSTFEAIEQGLRERGQARLLAQLWYADGQVDRLPALAQQVLQ
jgi:hypothetical protein